MKRSLNGWINSSLDNIREAKVLPWDENDLCSNTIPGTIKIFSERIHRSWNRALTNIRISWLWGEIQCWDERFLGATAIIRAVPRDEPSTSKNSSCLSLLPTDHWKERRKRESRSITRKFRNPSVSKSFHGDGSYKRHDLGKEKEIPKTMNPRHGHFSSLWVVVTKAGSPLTTV